jgi:hypothetical protein
VAKAVSEILDVADGGSPGQKFSFAAALGNSRNGLSEVTESKEKNPTPPMNEKWHLKINEPWSLFFS